MRTQNLSEWCFEDCRTLQMEQVDRFLNGQMSETELKKFRLLAGSSVENLELLVDRAQNPPIPPSMVEVENRRDMLSRLRRLAEHSKFMGNLKKKYNGPRKPEFAAGQIWQVEGDKYGADLNLAPINLPPLIYIPFRKTETFDGTKETEHIAFMMLSIEAQFQWESCYTFGIKNPYLGVPFFVATRIGGYIRTADLSHCVGIVSEKEADEIFALFASYEPYDLPDTSAVNQARRGKSRSATAAIYEEWLMRDRDIVQESYRCLENIFIV